MSQAEKQNVRRNVFTQGVKLCRLLVLTRSLVMGMNTIINSNYKYFPAVKAFHCKSHSFQAAVFGRIVASDHHDFQAQRGETPTKPPNYSKYKFHMIRVFCIVITLGKQGFAKRLFHFEIDVSNTWHWSVWQITKVQHLTVTVYEVCFFHTVHSRDE